MQEEPIKNVDGFMIDKKDTTRLFCPHCTIPLERVNEGLFCRRCQRTYKVVDGVPTFIEKSLYWGEIPQSEMQIINKRIKREYWKSVLDNFPSESAQKKRYFIENLTRANFHFLCGLNSDSSVLDIGSGMGTISESLSYYYKRVTAIEPVLERIIFSSIRFKQENIKNITLIRTDLNNLPFARSNFDLIIMNGVLEWVALYDPNKPPEIVQLEILKKLYRLLKPGGILYIGIENRIGFPYFLGSLDHSYLPYTSLMPRFLASWITKIKRGYPYRTYTYTLKGYKNLLSKADFKKINFYYPYGGYNNPTQIVPLAPKILKAYFSSFIRSGSGLKRLLKKVSKRLALSGAINWLSPDFLIFARKKGAKQINELERAICRAITKAGHGNYAKEFLFIMKNTSETHITLLVFIKLYQHPFLVVTYSLRERFNKIVEKEYGIIQYIRGLLPEDMRQSLPRPILLDYVEKRAVLIKGFIKGKKLEAQLNKKKLFLITNQVTKWLLEFHRIFAKNEVLFGKKRLNDLLYFPLKQFSTKNKFNIPKDFYAWIEKKVEKFENHSVQMSPQHGDFWYGNIVLSNTRLGIYDWEFFGEVNLPLFDLFHFLTTLLTSPDILVKSRKENFNILFSINQLSGFMRGKVFEIADKMRIEKEIVTFLYFLYLLNFYDKISVKFQNREITKDMAQFIKIFILKKDQFILNRD